MVRKSKSRVKAPAARTDREVLLNRWGIKIDPKLLELALTHRSWAHEQGGLPTNERLEFLGDSVLGLVVTEELYERFPGVSEGQLAKMRSATVSEPALAQIAQQLGLGEFILLGNGEAITGGREKASILSDTVEAMIGATYLTHGFTATRPVVQVLVSGFLNRAQVRALWTGKLRCWSCVMRMVWARLTMRLRALALITRAALGPALMWVSVS